MIKIEITNTKNSQKIEIVGHSDSTKEPCARVTSGFEMLACLMYRDLDELEQSDGYSLIVLNRTDGNQKQLKLAQTYFKSLMIHYPRTIKVEIREVENGKNN